MTHPYLSIITPSYNQHEYLEDNLKSIKSQEYPHFEHIVIDGGSDDRTVDLLKEYEDMYNLRWISEQDRGQSHAINKGVEMAKGDWIGWQNSDDFYLPGAFNKFVRTLERNPESDLICGDLLIVDEYGEEIGRKYSIPPSKFIQKHWSLFTSNQALFIHRQVFESVGLLEEDYKYVMDADLFWRITKADFEITLIPEFLGAIRKHEGAKTANSVNDRQQEEAEQVYEQMWYDKVLPQPMLETSAKALKAASLIKNNRWNALKWNLTEHL